MKLVHGAVAGTFPPVTVARTVARNMVSTAVVASSSADVEGLMDAFQGCGEPDQAELLLSKATLDEVLRTMTVSPAVSVYSDVGPDDDDEVAVYAVTDEPDDEPIALPVKVRRVRRTIPALPAPGGAPVYALPSRPTIGRKNLVTEFLLRTAAANWPDTLVTVSQSDLAQALESVPNSSSRDVAAVIAERFQLTAQQSMAVRRRAAAMVAMEQRIAARVRRLLPTAPSCPDEAVEAVRHIDELLRSLEKRPVLPFE